MSPLCDRAISDALRHGRAILKFISPNDVGLTGGKQYGYYLPKSEWRMFSPQAPIKGVNHNHQVSVVWQDGRATDSVVKWYGKGSRSEYRLTRFGRGFPYLDRDCVGNLLVLVIQDLAHFIGYVLDLEEDIESFEAALGISIVETWAAYDRARGGSIETEDECLDRKFREFTSSLTKFPSAAAFSGEARSALADCFKGFLKSPTDDQLMACVDAEYRLFRTVERKLCQPEVTRVFATVDEFIETAQSILQRRKSRAGRSLENHVESILKAEGIPHDVRQEVEGTRPDIIIPGKRQYLDKDYPLRKLFVIGVKTTCKDRWRQVLREAPRVRRKHILTVQPGISESQLREMHGSSVTLVVPNKLHSSYPKAKRGELLTVAQFVDTVRRRLR